MVPQSALALAMDMSFARQGEAAALSRREQPWLTLRAQDAGKQKGTARKVGAGGNTCKW